LSALVQAALSTSARVRRKRLSAARARRRTARQSATNHGVDCLAYDVTLPKDVVNQLHERSDVKVNSVLVGAVSVTNVCDEIAVSLVVSHCEGDS